MVLVKCCSVCRLLSYSPIPRNMRTTVGYFTVIATEIQQVFLSVSILTSYLQIIFKFLVLSNLYTVIILFIEMVKCLFLYGTCFVRRHFLHRDLQKIDISSNKSVCYRKYS